MHGERHLPIEQAPQADTAPFGEAEQRVAGRIAVRGLQSSEQETRYVSDCTPEEILVAWDKIKEAYSPTEVSMIRRMSEKGPSGFHRVRSAEAVPAGNVRRKAGRLKPAPPKS